MTLQEVAKKFPLGSLAISKVGPHFGKIGIIVGHREDQFGDIYIKICWIIDEHKTFEWGLYSDDIQSYGEIEAVKTLVDFAGRLLQGEATLGCGEEGKLKEAIATCEGAFGI